MRKQKQILVKKQYKAGWVSLSNAWYQPSLGWIEVGTNAQFSEVANTKPAHISDEMTITIKRKA